MNQNIFETRQRAAELLQEAVRIWQSSEQSEYLEGLDRDPVFKLLLNALAYQTNELVCDIDSFKDEILEEFDGMVLRGEGVKAEPAMAVISAFPASGVPDTAVDSSDEFFITGDGGARYSFTPLFKTRSINASVQSVVRVDAGRWSVVLESPTLFRNLSGLAFLIPSNHFQELKVRIADTGEYLPLHSPRDYADYPMADYFSLDTVLYNRAQAVNTGGIRSGMSPYSSYLAVDMFARCLADYYVVGEMDDFEPISRLNLVFEFTGIPDSFSFSMNDLKLNPVILINARRMSVNLSSDNRVEKLAGLSDQQTSDLQFLHLLPPEDDYPVTSVPIQVRRIGMERFNEGRLLRLLQNLIVKYNSDFHAFESIGAKTAESTMVQIQKGLSRLFHSVKSDKGKLNPGTYVYLDFQKMDSKFSSKIAKEKNISVNVGYLATDGSSVNPYLNQKTVFSGPSWLDTDRVSQLVEAVPGMDEIVSKRDEIEVSKYYLMTEDRIVTPYDIKLFCYKELQIRYGVAREMVEDISVRRMEEQVGSCRSYEAMVTITIKANDLIIRAFKDKVDTVQSFLARMIWAKSNGMYPISVKLILKK